MTCQYELEPLVSCLFDLHGQYYGLNKALHGEIPKLVNVRHLDTLWITSLVGLSICAENTYRLRLHMSFYSHRTHAFYIF